MLFDVGSIQRQVTAVLNLSLYNAIDDSQPEVVDSYLVWCLYQWHTETWFEHRWLLGLTGDTQWQVLNAGIV